MNSHKRFKFNIIFEYTTRKKRFTFQLIFIVFIPCYFSLTKFSLLKKLKQNKLEQNKRSAEKQMQENIFFMLTTVYDTTVDSTSWLSSIQNTSKCEISKNQKQNLWLQSRAVTFTRDWSHFLQQSAWYWGVQCKMSSGWGKREPFSFLYQITIQMSSSCIAYALRNPPP